MNTALPEMLHCLSAAPELERQRGRLRWPPPTPPTQPEEFCFSSFPAGDSALGEVVARSANPSLVLQGWPDVGKFGSCSYGDGSGCELGSAISRTSSCPPAVAAAAIKLVGRESLKKRKSEKLQSTTDAAADDGRDKKLKGSADENDSKVTEQNSNKSTATRETSADTCREHSKASEVQKPDYIHVRARRGQATDSHSLAERVRREKISERMRYLQDLVPGCNKITGKAGMLDEIINYVQSLQRQVEFLSMKLAAVNPGLDFHIDNFFPKELFPGCAAPDFGTMGIAPEMATPSYLQFNPVNQVPSCCDMEMGVNQTDPGLRRTISAPVSIPATFMDSSHCNAFPSWDVDLQTILDVEFQAISTPFPPPAFSGSIEAGNLKTEM